MTDRLLADALARGDDEAGSNRRDFLRRTAYLAGAAGVASLPTSALLSHAARAQALTSGLPGNPANSGLEHVVILMMENRSFDHYFGWAGDFADATNTMSFPDPSKGGAPTSTVRFSELGKAAYQGCGHPDPGHGRDSGLAQVNGGFLAPGSGNDIFALTYYDEGDLGFIQDAAKAYTLYDRFHGSLLASTWPNRYYKWSGQSGGRMNNSPPVETLGNQWDTIFDLALAGNPLGLPLPGKTTARYYNSDLPFSAVWGPRGVPWTRPAVEYFVDCAAGMLPNITIIDPPFRDGGGFDGNSADEHPHGDVRLGQAFMADVVNAFVESSCYEKGALFVVYDEWGGFFDHVAPPRLGPGADDRYDSDINKDFSQMGFRIPGVCVSPWTRNGGDTPARVDHGLYGFESILKLISWRWGLANLNKRHETATNVGVSFDWDNPDFERPDLPDPNHIVSMPCALGGGNLLPEDAAAHESDMKDLEALAVRFGFKVGDGKVEDIFRKPDSLKKAFRTAGT